MVSASCVCQLGRNLKVVSLCIMCLSTKKQFKNCGLSARKELKICGLFASCFAACCYQRRSGLKFVMPMHHVLFNKEAV